MKYKAVIFDLDGTLLNSLEGIGSAMNVLLEQMGFPRHSLDKYRYFVGEGLKELVRRALPKEWFEKFNPECQVEPALDELVVEYRRIYDEIWPQTSPPYSGVSELLKWLSNEGIRRGVLSNKSDDFTKRMVSALLPEFTFDMVLGSRPGIPSKPDPFSALEIAASLRIEPGNIIFLGDTGVDIQTAINAAMPPVGALWGFRDSNELRSNGAKYLIKQPQDLIDIIKGTRV